jgi:hypothetical protein
MGRECGSELQRGRDAAVKVTRHGRSGIWRYVANTDSIVYFRYHNGDLNHQHRAASGRTKLLPHAVWPRVRGAIRTNIGQHIPIVCAGQTFEHGQAAAPCRATATPTGHQCGIEQGTICRL